MSTISADEEIDGHRAKLEAMLPELRLYAIALAGEEGVEDLMQATLEAALRPHPHSDESRTAKGRLFQLMRSRWRQVGIQDRKRKRGEAEFLNVVNALGEEWGRETGAQLKLDLALQAMDSLQERQREVLEAVVIKGMTYEETSTALKIPIGTVMSRLSRARAALTAALQSANEMSRSVERGARVEEELSGAH